MKLYESLVYPISAVFAKDQAEISAECRELFLRARALFGSAEIATFRLITQSEDYFMTSYRDDFLE